MEKKKEITIKDLAVLITNGLTGLEQKMDARFKEGLFGLEQKMDARFAEADRKTDAKIESLAVMVQNGFIDTEKHLGGRIDGLKEDVDVLKDDVKAIKLGQERIESNMVYRLEFEKLEDRVAVLENKGKIKVKK